MKPQNEFPDRIYSFRALRKSVGWIGIGLPFVLMFGVFIVFRGPLTLYSISQYYYTGMRDVMVGALSAIALFLFFYKGYNEWDRWSSNLAGLAGLLIGIFPTVQEGKQDLSGNIHFISATIFFVTLACMSLFLFTKKGKDAGPNQQKDRRNLVYRICGIVIIACLIALGVFYKFFDKETSRFVFWIETLALVAFGASWLVKGGAMFADEEKKKEKL
jgi:hypothetical protein